MERAHDLGFVPKHASYFHFVKYAHLLLASKYFVISNFNKQNHFIKYVPLTQRWQHRLKQTSNLEWQLLCECNNILQRSTLNEEDCMSCLEMHVALALNQKLTAA